MALMQCRNGLSPHLSGLVCATPFSIIAVEHLRKERGKIFAFDKIWNHFCHEQWFLIWTFAVGATLKPLDPHSREKLIGKTNNVKFSTLEHIHKSGIKFLISFKNRKFAKKSNKMDTLQMWLNQSCQPSWCNRSDHPDNQTWQIPLWPIISKSLHQISGCSTCHRSAHEKMCHRISHAFLQCCCILEKQNHVNCSNWICGGRIFLKLHVPNSSVFWSTLKEADSSCKGPSSVHMANRIALNMFDKQQPAPCACWTNVEHFAIQEWWENGAVVASHIQGTVNLSGNLTKALG